MSGGKQGKIIITYGNNSDPQGQSEIHEDQLYPISVSHHFNFYYMEAGTFHHGAAHTPGQGSEKLQEEGQRE